MLPIMSSKEEVNSQNQGSHSDVPDSSRPILEPAKSSTLAQNEPPPISTPIPHSYGHAPHPSLLNPPVLYQSPIPSASYPSQPPAYYYPTSSYASPSPYQTYYPTELPHSVFSAPPQYYPPPQYHTSLPPAEIERHHFGPVLEKNSWALASAAAAVGSIVGLSAAAATRWWNGDDWYLVARDRTLPATTETQNVTPEKSSANINLPPINEAVGVALAGPNSAENEGQGEFTNRAMDLLRQQQLLSNSGLSKESLYQLRDVQESLASIQLALNKGASVNKCDEDLDSSSDRLMLRISTILVKLESILGIDKCDVWFHEPTEPVEARENELEPCIDIATGTPNSGSTPTVMELNAIDSEVLVTNLHKALAQLILGKDGRSVSHAQFISGIQLLYLYASNISNHPHVPRYRRIYCENESYRQNVEKLCGAAGLLEAMGFHLGQNSKYWEWMSHAPTSVEESGNLMENLYLERAREAVSALKVLKSASEAVGKEELLKSALRAAGIDVNAELDSNLSAIEALSTSITSDYPIQTLLADKDAIASQSMDTPFVCDTDLVTMEAAALLTGSAADGDFQRTKESDEVPPHENERISESEVWK
jgi:PUB domain